MNQGFYKTLSLPNYLVAEGLSKSDLMDLAISPAHYRARRESSKTFPAADLGSAVHMLVLEPYRAERFVVTPPQEVLAKNGSKNTNSYREWSDALPGGSIVLSAADYEAAINMSNSVFAHTAAKQLLTDGNPEVSAFWHDAAGMLRKCRPDFLATNHVVDLKTTISAEPQAFGRHSYNLKYHWSAAWTLDIIRGLTGSNARPYIIVAVEKAPPWAVACYEVPQMLIEMARDEIAPLLAKFRACLELETWPAYSDEIEQLSIPPWAVKKEMEGF